MKKERNSKQVKTTLNKSTHLTKRIQNISKNKYSDERNKTENLKNLDRSAEGGVPNITDYGVEEINEIIKRTSEMRKQYSKTYAEQNYTPLTHTEKMKFVEDFSMNSDKRLHLYSELFKEIKSQISFISNNISTTAVENEKVINERPLSRGVGASGISGMSANRPFNNRSGNMNSNMNDIDEENEVLDFSIEEGNPGLLIKKHSSKTHNQVRTPKAKIIKIDNPMNFNLIVKKESNLEGDCDCVADGEENIRGIIMPSNEYRSNYLRDIDYFSARKPHSHSASDKNMNRFKSEEGRYKKGIFKPIAATINPYQSKNTKIIQFIEQEPKSSFFQAKMELQANSLNSHNPQYILNKKLKETDYNAISSSYSHLNEEDLKMGFTTYTNKLEGTQIGILPHITTDNELAQSNNAKSKEKESKCLIF